MFGKVKDPVCGKKVKKSQAESFDLNGKTYYFDSPACKASFTENPQKYVKNESFRDKLKKWAESSDGKPRRCH